MRECSHNSDEITANSLEWTLEQSKIQEIRDRSKMQVGLDTFSQAGLCYRQV